MEITNIPLNSSELLFKHFYQDGGEKYLIHPMMLSEYRALPQSRRIIDKTIKEYHQENHSAEDVNTIRDIRSPGSDDLVHLNMHGRYSYPLMHNHGYVELIYVYHGTCTHFLNHSSFEMHTGDFCILSPNTVHAISAYHDDDIILNIIVSVAFFGSSFMKLLRKEPVIVDFFEDILYKRNGSPYILYPTGQDEVLHNTFSNMYKENRRRDYLYNESMSLYVRQIFIYLLRHYEMNAVIANPLNHTQESNIVALISYISVNYDHITLNSTADFFGYNVTYLSQLLKRCTGKTFSEMVNEAQMNAARTLLIETTLPITEIAYKIGCYDASHFTHKFKATYKLTPAQYRKAMNKQ